MIYRKSINIICILLAILSLFCACSNENLKNEAQNAKKQNMTNGTSATMSEGAKSSSPPENRSENRKQTSILSTGSGLNSTLEDDKTLNEDINSEKEIGKVASLHLQNLIYLLDKNEKEITRAFSNEYINILGETEKANLDLEFFQKFFQSEDFRVYYSREKIKEYLDLSGITVLKYDKIMKSPSKYYANNKVGFSYKKDDILALIPPKKGSSLINGWVGVYRKENGIWRIVAGSFPFAFVGSYDDNTTSSAIHTSKPVHKSTSSAIDVN